jgi:carbamoyl-phosphate synthase large subunit
MKGMDALNILVLGVGGNVSQGILKALALSRVPHKVIGACISPLALGLYTVDKSYVSPTVYDPAFPKWILNVCEKEGIHVILSGVEPVLAVLSRNAEVIRQETGAISIVSDPSTLSFAIDKLATCQWLESHGFNYPRYAPSWNLDALERLVEECGYPLIAKLCAGKGSHGLIEIHEPSDLEYVSGKAGYVVQELLGSSDTEYTVGCFSDRLGKVRGIISMRRELLQGTTYRAEVGEFPEIKAEACRIAAALKPMGPCNIQLRISDGKPTCFEINMRFSGTTPMRARLGFNDVEATLRHYVLGEEIEDLPLITKGIILRYWNEMYIDQDAYAVLRDRGLLDDPGRFDLLVEDYGMKR